MPYFTCALRTKQTLIWQQFKAGEQLANILLTQLVTRGQKGKPKTRISQYQAEVTKVNVLSQLLQKTDEQLKSTYSKSKCRINALVASGNRQGLYITIIQVIHDVVYIHPTAIGKDASYLLYCIK